jgi:hypothetical protein
VPFPSCEVVIVQRNRGVDRLDFAECLDASLEDATGEHDLNPL